MTLKEHLEACVIKRLNDMFVWTFQKKCFYKVLKL
jgi:hypothetical protein